MAQLKLCHSFREFSAACKAQTYTARLHDREFSAALKGARPDTKHQSAAGLLLCGVG
jgi:hypothetical protein